MPTPDLVVIQVHILLPFERACAGRTNVPRKRVQTILDYKTRGLYGGEARHPKMVGCRDKDKVLRLIEFCVRDMLSSKPNLGGNAIMRTSTCGYMCIG